MLKPALVALLTLTVSLAASAGPAQPAKTKRAQSAPQGTHKAASDNPYFTSDPDDARVLRPKPEFLERGFNRGYIERMAIPRLPQAALDELASRPVRHPTRLVGGVQTGPASPFAATLQSGNVIVVEGDNNTVVNTNNGLAFNQDALFDVAFRAIQTAGDNFDFVTIWTTFPDFNVAAFYLPLHQDVEGLGECDFDSGRTFGCIFESFDEPVPRLQGIVFMNSISTWQEWDRNYDGVEHPIDDFNSAIYSTLGQEVAHRWGSGLRFVDPRNGNVSNKLLGRDFSHWAAFVDTDASVMDGWDWEDEGEEFRLLNDMDIYSTLDLYTMGALPVAFAEPFFLIDGAQYTDSGFLGINGRNVGSADVLQLGLPSVSFLEENNIRLGATGERVDLTIQDVVNAEGNRCPDPDHTQKAFTQAMILVTRPGQSASAAAQFVDELETVNATWQDWWFDRTGRALTLCTNLDGVCNQASATLAGGFLDTPAADGDLIEPGDDITLKVKVLTSGDDVRNARLVVTLSGAGADFAELDKPEIALGDIDIDSEVEVPVDIKIEEAMPCGSPTIVSASIVSDNAPTVTEQYRLFPGYDQVFFESFGKADEFEVDNEDAASGAFERIDVQLTCDITPRTPERDASPANEGAYITGNTSELEGNANLTSPTIDLRGTNQPQLRFNYWLDGDGFLLVEASKDGGSSFVDAIKYEETAHEWQLGFVDINALFGGTPDDVVLRFTIQSRDAKVEGGIDEVKIIARAGQCAGFLGCGCNTTGDAGPQAALFGALGVFALRMLRRRKRA